MPDYTEHYSLKKPKQTENYDIDDVTRDNADLIDKALYEKVDKLPSKGLSTNDFTTPLLKKLNGIESGAQKNEEGTVIDNNYVHTDNNFTDAEKNKILELEQENNELSENMPWNTTQGKSIHITDSAKYSKNRLSLSGDMEQEKRSGYNLFDYINKVKKGTNYGVTITTDDEGYIIANGTIQDSYKSLVVPCSIDNILEDTETYTVWQEKHSSGLDGIYVQLKLVNKSTQAETFVYASNVNRKVVVDKNTYNYYINIQWATAEQVFSNYKNRYMLLKGDYTSTSIDYEQYGATPSTEFPSMPVACSGVQKIRQSGKNLLPNTAISKTTNGITFTVNDDGTVTVNGTATATAVLDVNRQNLLLETGDYMLSGCPSGGGADTYKLDFIAKNIETNIVRYPNDLGQTKYIQVIEPEIITVTRIVVYAGVTLNNAIFKPMLERGKTATDYKPYTEEINTLDLNTTELCAIKDTNCNVVAKDRDVFRNGKWQWEKKIKKRVLNGTENWYKSGNSANVSYGTSNAINDIDTSTITPETNKKIVAKAVCNYFPTVSLSTMFSNTEGFALDVLSNSIIELRLGFGLDTEITTVALLKEWLAQKYAEGNPVIVYYILKTPVYTDCTAEQSAVLDKLYNNFELQKGTNNIIVESENGVGVNLELEYMQDNTLKDKKLEDRVTALENLLSTTQTSALLLDNLQNDLESEVN